MPGERVKTAGEVAYRSGAVARLTGIPVQTLRVWERRYKIIGPRQSATGQRQYSSEDVARLTVIKQLVDSGHAIGSIAALDLNLLQSMRGKVARAAGAGTGDARSPMRAVIVGDALAMRVAHSQLSALQIVATTPKSEGALDALEGVSAEVLLIALPTLDRESAQAIRSLAQQLGAQKIFVEYGFGPQAIAKELRAMGCSLMHAPVDIDWLESLCRLLPAPRGIPVPGLLLATGAAAPRRFDDKTLAEISLASVVLNCECPHHVAELLIRLGNFETYSAECESRTPADAALHRYLKEVTGNARALLEEALVRVVQAEGISLPGG
jgi:MerR family transcriptional regulator, light-induced transcriptional regulator